MRLRFGLCVFMGRDASRQPGDLQDVMLHETAVSWLTARLQLTKPREEWKETEANFEVWLRAACQHVNDQYDVAGLRRELPARVQELLDLDGDRLSKCKRQQAQRQALSASQSF